MSLHRGEERRREDIFSATSQEEAESGVEEVLCPPSLRQGGPGRKEEKQAWAVGSGIGWITGWTTGLFEIEGGRGRGGGEDEGEEDSSTCRKEE